VPDRSFELSLLKIPVLDITVSAPFYRDGLGLEEQFVAAEYGWAQFQAGDLPIALYKPGIGGGNRTPGGSVDFHLSTPDLEGLQMRLQAFDPTLKIGIFKNDDGSETLEFSDPDGNEIKVSRT